MKELFKRRDGRHLRHRIPAPRRSLASTMLASLGAVALVGLLSSCREAALGLDGGNPVAARANAEELFGGLATRYSTVWHDPKYEAARTKLAQGALTPSKVFDDSSAWTSMSGSQLRMLLVQGTVEHGRYELVARPSAPRPEHLGDTRHLVTLARIGSDQYVWDTQVEHALGDIPARDVGAAISGLLRGPEGRTTDQMRAEYGSLMPRATGALGELFSMDSLASRPLGDGSSAVALEIGFHPEQLQSRYPAFAAYLAKYGNPGKFRLSFTDPSGAVWLYIAAARQKIDVRYRLAGGKLAPFTGAARPMPDTLTMHADISLKVKMFTVGVHDMATDFITTAGPHERMWTVVAQHEPKWDLPLITERLLRAPLRHPFEGEGVVFRIGVRDSTGAQTLLVRHSHLAVQESAILRFLGSLSSHAVSDLSQRAEVEEDLYLHEVFTAMQQDARGWARLGFAAPERPDSTNAAAR